jgi:hypothetical protein
MSPPSNVLPLQDSTRLRVAEIDLWSVTLTSALVFLGLGVGVAVAVCLSWIWMDVMNPEPEAWPSPMWGLTLLAVTVMVEVVMGTALATMTAFFYNVAAQHTGGIHLTLRRRATAPPGVVKLKAVLDREHLRSRLPVRLGARL